MSSNSPLSFQIKRQSAPFFERMALRAVLAVAAVTLGVGITVAPVYAITDFEQGCQFYNAKSYNAARACFERAVKQYPTSWQVHYYLANTFLAAGLRQQARLSYEQCIVCKPAPQVTRYCMDALAKIGSPTNSGAVGSIAASNASSTIAVAETGESTDGDAPSTVASKRAPSTGVVAGSVSIRDAVRNQEVAHADIVMRRAQEECDKIRAECREKIKTGGNQWYIHPDGHYSVGYLEEEEHEINAEAEQRCAAIMNHAERSVAHVRK